MVEFEFDEPLERTKPKGRPRKRSTGWHKIASNTWKKRARPKVGKAKRTIAIQVEIAPCPKCYAPMRDGVCTGAFHTRERLGK